jgi:hypothetical protein
MCQVIGNFFGGTLSLGIDEYSNLDTDNGDNGVYIIDENWNIVKRQYFDGIEQTEYNLLDCLVSINFCQPKDERVSIKTLGDYCIEIGNYTKEWVINELDELIYKCSSDYEQEIIDEIKQVIKEYE